MIADIDRDTHIPRVNISPHYYLNEKQNLLLISVHFRVRNLGVPLGERTAGTVTIYSTEVHLV